MATLRSYLNEHILRQYSIGPWLGAIRDLLGRTMFYMTPVNLFVLAAELDAIDARYSEHSGENKK